MWPYMIRINPKALLILISMIGVVVIFWYYLLFGTRDQLTNTFNVNKNINLKKLLIASVIAAERGGHEVVRIRRSNNLDEKSKGKTKEGVNDVLTRGDLRSHIVMVHALSAAFPGLRIISEEHIGNEEKMGDFDVIPINVDDELMNDDKYSQLPDNYMVPLEELNIWIDPLDATKEYSEGLTQYVTTMVCVARKGEPIIGVIHKPFETETYWAWNHRGISSNIKSIINDRSNPTHSTSNNSFRVIVSRSHAGNVHQRIDSSFSKYNKNLIVIPAAGSGYKTIELIKGNAEAYIHITLIKKWDICAPNALLNSINNGKMTTINGNSISYGYEDDVQNQNGLLATFSRDHDNILNMLKTSKD